MTTRPLRLLMVGKQLGQYRILELLGSGGMGEVFLAQDTRLGRQVAVKVLHSHLAADEKLQQRFYREARAAATLSHPGIATLFALEEIDDIVLLTYEFVPGRTLDYFIRSETIFLPRAVRLAVQIAGALGAAHDKGVIHRDLKPKNVMLTPDDQAKILDFGLARFVGPLQDFESFDYTLTTEGTLVGTVGYMSPEQLESARVDSRSDLFSFGILFYEMITGSHPFEGGSPASTIANIIHAEPASVSERNRDLPDSLNWVIRKCLRKRPEERYQSSQDLATDLEEIYREIEPSKPSRPHSPGARQKIPSIGRFSRPPDNRARLWWKLNHLATALIYPAVCVLAWFTREWIETLLGPAYGSAHLVAILLFATITTVLRVYLLITAGLNLQALDGEVFRWSRLILASSVMVWILLLAEAGAGISQGSATASLLFAFSLGGLIATLVAEPTIEHSAFPS